MKGSFWSKWDLQVQTILDDDYIPLKNYFKNVKSVDEEKWNRFVEEIGKEEDVLLFDSKEYFFNGQGSDKNRADNYANVFFTFLEDYCPDLECIAITDHNHIHDHLMNSLWNKSQKSKIKIIPGVEVNSDGIHMLLLFSKIPCQKDNYSEGIKTFLTTIGVVNKKNKGSYMLTNDNVLTVMEKTMSHGGLVIFAHCNSDNGLFQERPRTDRTLLANIYNEYPFVILQERTASGIKRLKEHVDSHDNLSSKAIITIASDARKLSDIGTADKDGFFQYIKGEASFECLRQAIFEPESRMRIAKNLPIYPIHKIESLDIKLPEDTKINDEKFCFRGEYNFKLHPNYTCFIGGRGTGKSTILNLMHSKASVGKNEFFYKNKLKIGSSVITDIGEYVKLDGDSDTQMIDFISQNEIEKYATDQQLLTKALFVRVKKIYSNSIEKRMKDLSESLERHSEYIDNLQRLSRLEKLKSQKSREIKSNRKILSSFESEDYKKIQEKVSKASDDISYLLKSKKRFNEVRKNLKDFHNEYLFFYKEDFTPRNEYDKAIVETVKSISSLLDTKLNLDEPSLDTKYEKIQKDFEEAKHSMNEYLKSKELTEESMSDVSEANKKISDLTSEVSDLVEKEKILKSKIDEYNSTLEESSVNYLEAVRAALSDLNSKLTNLSDQVKTIELKINISHDNMIDRIFESFKDKFKLDSGAIGTKETTVKDFLFKVELSNINSQDTYLEAISGHKKSLNKAQEFLIELFSVKDNFDLFKEIINLHTNDVKTNQVINVLYDSKKLSDSSFGQRCTAALVLMLILGNNPIIIDEPEGHLDSLLIANYLVDLIKQMKNNRQIIFATHNANLVVNGDADLIYYLEMGVDGKTKYTDLTLEDINNRQKLISLEGGHEAFNKRENKYKKF